MSALLSCKSLSKSFGARPLFSGIDFTIHPGERLGLTGPNGSGKSTFLKILAGLTPPDNGTVTRQKHLRCSYLEQDSSFADDARVGTVLAQAMETLGPMEAQQYARVNALLNRAGFNDPQCRVDSLSGGRRKMLAICRALVCRPDLLLMDEPTNHLDIASILRLEKLLTGRLPESPKACVIVSHDRTFLEHVADQIIELSQVYPRGYLRVTGGYDRFVEKRTEFLESRLREEQRLANRSRRENEWLQRGPKARTGKARSRIEAAHELHKQLADVRRRNRAAGTIRMDFESTGRKTRKLLEARGLTKGYDRRPLFSNLDITLTPGSRLGLMGGNGCGKTTLMRLLAAAGGEDDLRPDSGTIRVARNLRIVYFAQQRQQLPADITLRRALAPEGDSVVYRGRGIHVNGWARRFLFENDQLETPLGKLSGGERARVRLADLIRRPADILLLDEPTNDLDIPSLEVLEESLLSFPGALVLVTHDRYLLDRLTHRILGFDGNGGVEYYADYRQWLAATSRKQGRQRQTAHDSGRKKPRKKSPKPGKLSYLDQRLYDGMEESILAAEEEADRIRTRMTDPRIAANPEKLEQCWLQLAEVEKKTAALYDTWQKLEDKKRGRPK